MSRPALEVADIFRGYGSAWRQAHAGHVSLDQLKVMSAIESCRTAALGGHVARCEDCAYTTVAYNSCRNRHCPKCQGAAAKEWLADREADLLPVPYYHVVFTLPGSIADIAYQNKAVIYDLLFKVSAETMLTIAADPKHLGARIGITSVLHTWGSAMTHHPHVHMIVPGGGISLDDKRWVSCRRGFFLPVRVLSRLFRRLFQEKLIAAHQAGRLSFFGANIHLADAQSFAALLAPLRKAEWVVYSKRPFGGPEAVLAYLSRYTHRVAIANTRLIAFDEQGRAAIRLPPHPPLRPVRQKLLRRQHRTRARAARRCKASGRAHRSRRRSNQADLSMLRRSHDHHRGLRARCHATAAADRFNDRHQGRHLMTTSQSRKSAHRVRWLSTGHGRARSDIPPSSQIVRQFTAFDPTRRSFTRRFTVGQLAGAARPQSHTSPAALKSP